MLRVLSLEAGHSRQREGAGGSSVTGLPHDQALGDPSLLSGQPGPGQPCAEAVERDVPLAE